MKILPLMIMMSATALSGSGDELREIFLNPPPESRTKVWWFQGEAPFTTEGCDADLREFRDKGVGGVVWYDQVHGRGDGASESMSPEWWRELKYAAGRAADFGLTFEVAAGNGYVTGGPWITPELSMKKTVFADTLVTLDAPATIVLPRPVDRDGYTDVATIAFPADASLAPVKILEGPVMLSRNDTIVEYTAGVSMTVRGISYEITPRGKGSTGSMNIPGAPSERYFAAKYTEYPPVGFLEYLDGDGAWQAVTALPPVENNIGHKSRRRSISFPAVTSTMFRLRLYDRPPESPDFKTVSLADVRLYQTDMVDNIESRSALRTEVVYPHTSGGDFGAIPSGDIKLLSLEDDSVALSAGTWRIIRMGYAPTGARTKHGRRNQLGYEADVMSAEAVRVHYENYFHRIADTLRRADIPLLGMIQDSHEAGVQNWTEGFETPLAAVTARPVEQIVPMLAGYIVDNRQVTDSCLLSFRRLIARSIADNYYGTFAELCRRDSVDYTSQAMLNIATDNIAARGRVPKPQGEFWTYQTDGNYDSLDAASAAHIYGHPIASAEAFTDTPYSATWEELLRIASVAWCRGINEFVVCASQGQPYLHRRLDDEGSVHPYVFHRFHPRWNESREFWDIQARTSAMLRQGRPVVDLCVLLGTDPPLKTMAYRLPEIPNGYNFDVVSAEAMLSRLNAGTDGGIDVEGGMHYRALVVPERCTLAPDVNQKLDELAAAGAKIVRCDRDEKIGDVGFESDVALDGLANDAARVMFFHRVTDEGRHIYYVYNHTARPVDRTLLLRDAAGMELEEWHPVTKDMKRVSDGRMRLEPYEAKLYITK